jgi:hypothetical protein
VGGSLRQVRATLLNSKQVEVKEGTKEVWFQLKVTHSGKEYVIEVAESDR